MEGLLGGDSTSIMNASERRRLPRRGPKPMAEETTSDTDRQFDATLCLEMVVTWASRVIAKSPEKFEAWVHQEQPAAKTLNAAQISDRARTALQMLTNLVRERYEATKEAEDIAKGD